jgi:hypothetical protein
MPKYPPVPPGKKLIFRPWRIDPKTGERIYPKRGGVFPMIVDDDEQQSPPNDFEKNA